MWKKIPGTTYYKKWTRMPWWSRLYHLRQRKMIDPDSDVVQDLGDISLMYDKYMRDITPNLYRLYREGHTGRNPGQTSKDQKEDPRNYFLRELFNTFPELRNAAVTTETDAVFTDIAKKSNIETMKLVERLYRKFDRHFRLSKDKKKATRDTLEDFESEINLKLEDIKQTEDIAASSRAVPLLNVLRDRNTRESYLKAKRGERDNDLIEEMTSRIGEIEEFATSYKVVSPEYEVLTEDVYSFEESTNLAQQDEREIRGFVERNWRLFWQYWNSRLTTDQMAAFEDRELLVTLRLVPSALEKLHRPLVRQLEKYGVTLDSNGDVDYSKVEATDQNRAKKFKNIEGEVKFALMLKDLDFGHDHRQQMRQAGRELTEQAQKHNEEAAKLIEETNKKKVEEMIEKLRIKYTELDDMLNFKYFNEKNKEDLDVREKIYPEELNLDNFLSGKFGRIDFKNRLPESLHERNLRLEAIWLRNRINNNCKRKFLDNSIIDKFVQVTLDTRRLKLALDKKHFEESGKVFFAEHVGARMDIAATDLPKLQDYLTIDRQVFFKDTTLENEYQKSKSLLQQKILKKDYVDPFGAPEPIRPDDVTDEYWKIRTDLKKPPTKQSLAIDPKEEIFFSAFGLKMKPVTREERKAKEAEEAASKPLNKNEKKKKK